MATLNGFRLTLDPGGSDQTIYRAKRNFRVNARGQSAYLLDGLRNYVALFNTYIDELGGQPGRADTNFAGVYYGFGSGSRSFQISFIQSEGSSETWGDTSASDSAMAKKNDLDVSLATIRADSENPAKLEFGEFNDTNGTFDSLSVALGEWDLQIDVTEQTSWFMGQLTFFEAIDVSGPVSAQIRGG